MSKKRQALIEFIEITSSINCVNDANRLRHGIKIGDSIAYLNYSNYQTLKNKRYLIRLRKKIFLKFQFSSSKVNYKKKS